MSQPESLTQPTAALAIARRDRATALAWLELVGSWPSSDRDVAMTTAAAERLLGFPSDAPFTGAQLDAFLAPYQAPPRPFRQGDRVLTTHGHGAVAWVRMAPPNYATPEAVSVVLDSERQRPGYRGTVFPAAHVVHASPQNREGV